MARPEVVVAFRVRVEPTPRLPCAGKVMVWLPLAMLKVMVALPVPEALVALIVTVLPVAAVVGVPVMAPVEVFKERPAGRDPLWSP